MNTIIIGAQASGKMTIGQELANLTGATLFHNHETIDFVLKFMPMSDQAKTLIDQLRFAFLKTFAQTGQEVIFTVVIDFGNAEHVAYLEELQTIFQEAGRQVLFVELDCDLEERLRRNRTENRLTHKPLKRDLDWSETDILETVKTAQFTTSTPPKNLVNYLKITNTNLSAEAVASLIAQYRG